MDHRIIKSLIRIRIVEEAFLELFSQGKLNGTVHTCIGQELSALAFAGQLKKTDFIFSNHRCHGHYMAYTDDWKGLILELMGKKGGVCSGIGSSQHLHKYNFFSNGIQGGIMPVSAGFALGNKLNGSNNVGIVFIGDGTLGEGTVYETLNFVSKKSVPLLIVCENNRYAQSTPIDYNLAGNISDRPKAFGIETRESSTWDNIDAFIEDAKKSIDFVRTERKPLFHLVNTYRLKAHSKGDDDRSMEEINYYQSIDFLEKFKKQDNEYYTRTYNQVHKEVWEFINSSMDAQELNVDEYLEHDNHQQSTPLDFEPATFSDKKYVSLLNETFKRKMDGNDKVLIIGEDILDPYGGAFKVTKGLSSSFPDRVIGTAISESLIAGVSNGLALNGYKPIAEFMFGDFTALAFDQMLNHAGKFYNMYNKQMRCPVIFRTPMGGHRGYGPTHSQSIEKHFVGIDTFEILATNFLLDPDIIYSHALNRSHPTLVIENKTDYGKKNSAPNIENYDILISNESIPNILLRPLVSDNINATIITYGGSLGTVLEGLDSFFKNLDILPQIFCLTKIDPLPLDTLLKVVDKTELVITVEEGTPRGGIGNNIIAALAQKYSNKRYINVSSDDISIPSVKHMEENVLINKNKIFNAIKNLTT